MGIFSNREIAIAIWSFIFFVFIVSNKSIRASLIKVLKALFVRKLLILLFLLFVYVFLIVLLMKYLCFWDLSALKDTVFWVFGGAVTSSLNAYKATTNEHYFRDFVFDNLRLVAALEFALNLYSFSLTVEFIVIPIVISIIGVYTVAKRKQEYKQVTVLLDLILVIFSVILLIFTFKGIITDFSGFASITNLRDFLLPLVLSFLFLPFIYLTAVFEYYEELFVRIDIVNAKSKIIKKAKRRIFLSCFLNLKKLVRVSKNAGLLKINNDEDILKLLHYSKEQIKGVS